jgi:hypothetical protein
MKPLREFLDLNQTRFGSLLGIHQPEVSVWESPDKRDVSLPGKLAKAFLEVWDCFSEQPVGGFDEIMAALVAYRNRSTRPVDRKDLVRLIPAKPVSAEVPEIYWVPKERPPATDEAQEPASSPGTANAADANSIDTQRAEQRDIVRATLSISGLSILFAVWRQAQGGHRDTVPQRRSSLGQWAIVAPLVAFLLPIGCFQAHLESLRDKREPLRIPDQIYTDEAKKAGDAPRRSIPMPDKPYSWQKTGTCDPGEYLKVSGCWWLMDRATFHPPCPEYAVESENMCYVPVPAKPKPDKPNSVFPEK